jgi:outer membrane protein insertion porin family
MVTSQTGIKNLLGKTGFHFAKVDVLPDVDEQNKTVKLIYRIQPGKKVYVRRINFDGNFNTDEIVLRREMRLMEGSVLASDQLQRSKIRLQRLSYMENVQIKTVPVPGVNNLVDLDVSVEERLSGSFNIGAGFSQSQGFLFNVGLTQENLFGTGQRLQVNVNTDDANTIYNLSFTDPYFTIDGVSRTISASYQNRDAAEEDIQDFQSDTYGASVNYGIPLTEYHTLRLGYGYRHVDITRGFSPSITVDEFLTKNGSIFDSLLVNTSLTHDTRNRTVFATRGSSQTIGLNATVPGSDLEYYKITYDTKFYFGLTDNLTLLLRSNLAYGDGYGETDELPFFERYFAGGLRTVRGYDSNSLGPRDGNDPAEDPVGGNMRVTAGADFIFPIPFVEKPPSTVRLSAFYDIGNVFLDSAPTFDSTKVGFDAGELRTSVGMSFVWLAPIGPLRFSWARALNNVPGDEVQVFQFSIGSFF